MDDLSLLLGQLQQSQGISPVILNYINGLQQQFSNEQQVKSLQDNYEKNKQYSKSSDSYVTTLTPEEKTSFQNWVKENKAPYNESLSIQDYDMPGFWKALQSKDPKAVTAIDPNDKLTHYPDYWKTPYHETFSSESQWATKNAPKWNDKDQLVDISGKIIFNDRKK